MIPGFENYNERVREPDGFYLPNAARERIFKTASGKAQFHRSCACHTHDLRPGQFLMMTIRSHDQYNTTIYGLDDRYRGIENERRVVLLNATTCKKPNLEQGQVVDLISHFQGEERIARRFIVVPYPHPAPLRRHLFSRSQRARADRQRGREEQHAGFEVGCDHDSTCSRKCR